MHYMPTEFFLFLSRKYLIFFCQRNNKKIWFLVINKQKKKEIQIIKMFSFLCSVRMKDYRKQTKN